MSNLLQQIKDPYDRMARLTPALLVSVPILIPLVCSYGPKNPMLVAVVGLLTACGVLYALASIARGRGKKLEEQLVKKWGGLPSTVILRHRDDFLDIPTKQRYHARIVEQLGISMPSAEEEARDPAMADQFYMGAVRRLRELTRSDKALLLKENIAYGFHRNMLAMKVPGILSSLTGLVYGLIIAKVILLFPFHVELSGLADPGLAGGLTLSVSLLLLCAWLFYFNEDKVRRIGVVYAERLLEALAAMPSDAPKPKRKRPSQA